MESKERGRCICRVARQRVRTRQDVGDLKYVRYQQSVMLTEEKEIKNRLREYFENILNVENEREDLPTVERTEGPVQNFSKEEIKKAVNEMKSGKAAGCSGFVLELIKTLDGLGIDMIHSIMESIWEEEAIPEDSEKSIIVPIYKQKGDPMDCGNNRGIKLLEQIMKVLEKVLDQRLSGIVSINNMQMGFMQGRRTTDAIFMVKQLQEKFWEVKKDLFF